MTPQNPQGIKLRVLERYCGAESDQFGGHAVPEGAKIVVAARRARELISKGIATPIIGPAETKPTGPVEKKAHSGTDGPAAPLSSSPVAQASLLPTATSSAIANERAVGGASRSRKTSGASPPRTRSTGATATGGKAR